MPPDEPPQGLGTGSMDSPSGSSIRELSPDDPELRRTIGTSLGRAFRDEPNFTFMVPGSVQRRRALPWFFGSFVAELGLRRGVVDVTSDGSAAAVWLAPGERVGVRDALAAGLALFPLRLGAGAAWRASLLSGAIEGERAERMEVPHWYLMALGVDPERQGRGLGEALLKLGLGRADRSRHPVYLETFRERTARMYARFGFETVGRARVGRTGPQFIAMLRPLPSRGTG